MKGGVLIIGSLYWDIHQGEHLEVRKKWRDERLQFDQRIQMFCPIRYGRTSGDGVYTMVFSQLTEANNQWGTAYIAPFQKQIESFPDLLDEAEAISFAEGSKDRNLVKGDKNIWCVIGIQFNPNFDALPKKQLLNSYQQKLVEQHLGNVYESFCIPPELSILSSQGEILLNWPKATNAKNQESLDTLDFIVATCPKQNLKAYPASKTIKNEVVKDARSYFYNNIANGITTYQDREIMEA